MKHIKLAARWLVGFVIFWVADMALWCVMYAVSNFYRLGTPMPLTWRNAASDTWGWGAGEIIGIALGLRIIRKSEAKNQSNENSPQQAAVYQKEGGVTHCV